MVSRDINWRCPAMSQPNYPRDRMLPTRLVRERYLIVDRTINRWIDRGILPEPCVSMACATGAKVTWRSASGKACLPATRKSSCPTARAAAPLAPWRVRPPPISSASIAFQSKTRSSDAASSLSFKAPSLLGRVPFVSIVPSAAAPHAALPVFARCAVRSTARPQRSAGASTICHRAGRTCRWARCGSD